MPDSNPSRAPAHRKKHDRLSLTEFSAKAAYAVLHVHQRNPVTEA
jgi:hypothetical protein